MNENKNLSIKKTVISNFYSSNRETERQRISHTSIPQLFKLENGNVNTLSHVKGLKTF